MTEEKIKEIESTISKLNEEEVIKNISQYSSIKLSDIVIAYRYFGLYEKISMAAMEELGKRREKGDDFDFEKYIEDNLNSLPKLEFKIADLSAVLKNFSVKGFSFKHDTGTNKRNR